jgi:hypothetical protein
MGIEYNQNTAVSLKFASERVREAEEKLKAQTKVVDRLKAQLKEETDALSWAKAFSLQSTAAYTSSKLRPVDVDAIRLNAWRAMNEKQAAKDSRFFYREDKQMAAQAAGPKGVAAAAAAVAVPRDRAAWERSVRIQFNHFKANHRLGRRAATALKAAAAATAAKQVGVLAKRKISPAAGSGAAKEGAGKQGVKINGRVELMVYDLLLCSSDLSGPASAAEEDSAAE